jgi:uncharacterized protein
MVIKLTDLLSNAGYTKTFSTDIGMKVFESDLGSFEIVEDKPVELVITNIGKNKVEIHGLIDLSLNIPCDRCLADVKTRISLTFNREVDICDDETKREEDSEEQDYIDGYNLDLDKLVHNEILMHFPGKTLCRLDCKGLCTICGANLNESECGCDRQTLDPRMSVIQDIFKNFKEV